MQNFGMHLDPITEIPPPKDRVHINKIWYRYETYRAGIGIQEYMLPQSNPFDNWDISDRYAHESSFGQPYVEQHRLGVKEVRKLINKALLEGRLLI
jgi:hypothetical protein